MKKVLVIGGPGTISRGTLADLPKNGAETAVFTTRRDGKTILPDVRYFWGDRNDPAALKSCVDAFKPDTVIDTICYFKPQAEVLCDMTRGRIGQLIFISTVVVYGPTATTVLPVREEYPALVDERNSYGWNKLACEYFYDQKRREEAFPVTIVRPAYSFGPKVIIGMFADGYNFLRRLRDGLPIVVPSCGQTVFQACPGPDVGRMIARIALDGRGIGKTYNLSHETIITQDDYIQAFALPFGKTPEIVHIPYDVIDRYGDLEMVTAAKQTGWQSSVFAIDAFKTDFPGFTWSPFQPAFDETVAECEKLGLIAGPAPRTRTDDMIDAWMRVMAGFVGKGCMVNQ